VVGAERGPGERTGLWPEVKKMVFHSPRSSGGGSRARSRPCTCLSGQWGGQGSQGTKGAMMREGVGVRRKGTRSEGLEILGKPICNLSAPPIPHPTEPKPILAQPGIQCSKLQDGANCPSASSRSASSSSSWQAISFIFGEPRLFGCKSGHPLLAPGMNDPSDHHISSRQPRRRDSVESCALASLTRCTSEITPTFTSLRFPRIPDVATPFRSQEPPVAWPLSPAKLAGDPSLGGVSLLSQSHDGCWSLGAWL